MNYISNEITLKNLVYGILYYDSVVYSRVFKVFFYILHGTSIFKYINILVYYGRENKIYISMVKKCNILPIVAFFV